jgi:GDP-L-fucose synthase
MTEDALLTKPLEPTNQWYAVAKIAGLKMCEAYRKQYGFNCISVMPTNLYGPNDHFDSENAHVVPSLISKFANSQNVTVWGTGKPKREFLHVDDLADALIVLMEKYEGELINIGSGEEVTIRELAELLAAITHYKGKLEFDASRPDGPKRKVVDSSKIRKFWRPKIGLGQGLVSTVEWYNVNRKPVLDSGVCMSGNDSIRERRTA